MSITNDDTFAWLVILVCGVLAALWQRERDRRRAAERAVDAVVNEVHAARYAASVRLASSLTEVPNPRSPAGLDAYHGAHAHTPGWSLGCAAVWHEVASLARLGWTIEEIHRRAVGQCRSDLEQADRLVEHRAERAS